MSLEKDLYQEIIIEHYRAAKNRHPLPDANAHAEGMNPSCGDEVKVYLKHRDGMVDESSYEGNGCSICCASANMLCEIAKRRSVESVRGIYEQFRAMLVDASSNGMGKSSDGKEEEILEDLEVLAGVRHYPLRIKCALLPWSALVEAMGWERTPIGNKKK